MLGGVVHRPDAVVARARDCTYGTAWAPSKRGQEGRPGPLGSPVRVKLAQERSIWSDSARCSGVAAERNLSSGNRYGTSAAWKAPGGRSGGKGRYIGAWPSANS
jgi:hypothetical protein